MIKPAFIVALIVAVGCITPAQAADEPYATRPITLIVPFAAGGTSDMIARLVADRMGQALGQRVVIENVPGAGG